jgi:hypothetical protein
VVAIAALPIFGGNFIVVKINSKGEGLLTTTFAKHIALIAIQAH